MCELKRLKGLGGFKVIQEYLFFGDEKIKDEDIPCFNDIKPKVEEIENSDCIIVKYEKDGNNEDSAKILSAINEEIKDKYNPTVLTDEASAYFNKNLYPLFNEFERKLRKLLYIKSALYPNQKTVENINDLESKDLGEIFTLLFTDNNFVTSARNAIKQKTWQFTKAEMLESLQKIDENTLWGDLFGKNSICDLPSRFLNVKNYRNDIMHAHNLNYDKYKKIKNFINKINNQIDAEISNAVVLKKSKSDNQSEQNYNTILNTAINLQNVANGLASNFVNLSSFSHYEKIASAIADALDEQNNLKMIPLNLPSEGVIEAIKEQQIISNYLAENNLTIGTLQQIEQYQRKIYEFLSKNKEYGENKDNHNNSNNFDDKDKEENG